MPEVGEIVELDNGVLGRVVEITPDSIRVELLNADETPTGETVDMPLPPPEDEPAEVEAPEGDSAEAPDDDEMEDEHRPPLTKCQRMSRARCAPPPISSYRRSA